jgi:predicted TIM-barrel fold metal-dependent hydrolase
MKENKTLISAIAVMITAVLWAIFTTIACVKLDMQKQELKDMAAHCQEQWRQCQEAGKQTSKKHPEGAYHLEDISFLDAKITEYCPIYFSIMGKANLTYDYKNQHIWRINH